MMDPRITVLAAGSLRAAFTPLIAAFTRQTGLAVALHYGPAGLLRERILAGEPCSLFASADRRNAQWLIEAGVAQACFPLAANRLMLSTRATLCAPGDDWLTLLRQPTLRVATSTPYCDPAGDYTWQFFARLEQGEPGLGAALRQRAQPLVGGRTGVTIPPGECAAAWLIRQGVADLFIGYAHYARQLVQATDLRLLPIPEPWNVACDYQLARLASDSASQRLSRFILGETGQMYLRRAGFLPPRGEAQTGGPAAACQTPRDGSCAP
ncbi:molybdate ABC transporter substrate-binding protein [Edwardsiella hoshinae]|uniref:Molybdate ABC transporter substrate-binding protein n=1 Tax=Edwardsiella hoshinae TaxID=93378 RepID=A0ABN4SVB4_9GAMM|nr:molybdate ABC transporter substrate-binding protein [Edwardsiella hoshinae]